MSTPSRWIGLVGMWVLGLATAAQGAGDLTPGRLRCEYAENPLAVEASRPGLSWISTTTAEKRGLRQSAYQVLVASTAERLAGDQGDLWDSGKVAGNASVHVEYAGRALSARQSCFWKVRVWDQDGQQGPWSAAAQWSMGLLEPGDWQAKWIQAEQKAGELLEGCGWYWHGPPGPGAAYPPGTCYFRRTLVLPEGRPIQDARFTFAIDNAGTLHVNGRRIADSPDWQTAVTVDLTSALRPGVNALAITAVNLTDHPNPAGVIGKLVIRWADGQEQIVRVDEQWKSADRLQARWEWREFDDSSWPAAAPVRKYREAPWADGPTALAPMAMPIFRRSFDLPAGRPVRRAVVHACGLGQHELRLNGEKVGQAAIEPSWSNYRRTCYYSSHDVTRLLRSGTSAMGLMLGNGMYNVVGGRYVKFRGSFGPPKLICQLEIEHADGTRTVVASDERWKWSAGPVVFSCTYGGEDYDARQEQAGWDAPGFNAAAWLPAKTAEGPGGVLRAEIVEPVQAMSEHRPVKVTQAEPGVWVYDLGLNFSGWPRIRVRGPAGATIKLTPGELLDDRGRVTQRSSGGPMWFSYTLRGDPRGETWHPRFSYYGFRYIEVQGARPAKSAALAGNDGGLAQIDELSGEFLYTASAAAGRFECSNPTLNRIHALIDTAIKSNFKSVLTDCPHREKLGWLEVSHLLGASILYNYDGARFYRKICRDMREAQLDNGMVPDIAPEYTVFSGGFRDSPEWGSASVVNPWILWQTYGDRRALEENYPAMKRYTDYLASRADANGIVAYGLGDWCDVGPRGPGPSQLTSLGLTSTAMLVNNLRILERTARVLGKTEEADRFGRRAESVREAFQKAFFHARSNQYDRNSQAANAIPLALEIADPDRRPAILDHLVRDIRASQNRVTAGDVGFVYLVRALSENGCGQVLYDMMVQDAGPGYVYQLRKGATSLIETWDANPLTSQNHCMLGHAEQWLYDGLAGIIGNQESSAVACGRPCREDRPPDGRPSGIAFLKLNSPDPAGVGFQRFVLRPQMVDGLDWVRAHYDSIHGRIASHWKRQGKGWSWDFTVPPNTTATVYVPTQNPASLRESGRPVGQAEGIQLLRTEPGALVFAVGSGHYCFSQ